MAVAYAAAILYLFLFERIFWTPDLLFFVIFALFLLIRQGLRFIKAFAPFIILLLMYDSFRGIADDLAGRAHYAEMINFDKALFGGTLPTTWLQQHLAVPEVLWYDYYFYLLYMAHFIVPVLFGIYLWKRQTRIFNRYVATFVALSFAGFLTYLAFPAAPPWMAAEQGLIPPIQKISSDVWTALGIRDAPSLYRKIDPNPVAAVPSLHSAYPLLLFLFSFAVRRWWVSAIFGFYTVSIWFGVVYMGEHYVIDVILGALYACGAYLAVMIAYPTLQAWLRKDRQPN